MKKGMMKDLGLSYVEAAHGVQTAMALEQSQGGKSLTPKHLRTGLNLRAADTLGLVCLLMDKGVFTEEEYLEYIRLSANHEVALEEARHPGMTLR
jgi:hypothetical protein